jgi:hypothetical protein
MITIIHPSRSRPQQAMATAKKWIDQIGLSQDEFEYVMSLDSDDPSLWGYTVKMPCLNFTRLINNNKSAVEAINVAGEFYSKHRGNPGDFLIVVSDDFDCPEDWGKTLQKAIGIEEDRCYKTIDDIQDWIITLPIMDWKYYNRFGYIYHPSYQHQFCDTELTCVAEMTGGWVQLLSNSDCLTFKHLCDSLPKDDLNKRNDATFEEGKRNFIERKKRNFDLKPEDIKFPMPNNIYTIMQ